MKTYNNILFLSLLGIFLLSSCSNQNEFEPQLVIYSLISPDESFEVRVQQTAPTLSEYSDQSVNNAIVTIINSATFENIKMFSRGDGIYTSAGRKPVPGNNYEIQVEAPGFKNAAATTSVPDLGDVTLNIDQTQLSVDRVEFSFSPTMLSNKPLNYFAYELVYIEDEDEDDPEPNNNGGNAVNTEGINPDLSVFSNSLKPVLGSVSDGGTGAVETSVDFDEADFDNISVRIVAVSTDYYDYLVINQKEDPSPSSSSILVNNTPLYSNFVGDAYGIFGGFSQKTIKLMQ